MHKLRIVSIAAAIALGLASTAGVAADCSALRAENASLKRQFQDLAAYEWASAIVFGGCLAVGMSEYERTRSDSDAVAAVLVCAGTGCALTTSYQNCLSVNATLFGYALRGSIIEDQLANWCRY